MKKHPTLSTSFLIVTGVLLLIAGCSSIGPLTAQEAKYPVNKIDAPGIFKENCATCHGIDGRAETFHGRLLGAQNFTDPKWQAATSNQEILHAIKTGPGPMPAFAKKLSPTEIEALANYVRSFKPAH